MSRLKVQVQIKLPHGRNMKQTQHTKKTQTNYYKQKQDKVKA
jgi:hypothetical protein